MCPSLLYYGCDSHSIWLAWMMVGGMWWIVLLSTVIVTQADDTTENNDTTDNTDDITSKITVTATSSQKVKVNLA